MPPDTVQDPVFTGRFQRETYVVEKYFVKGEGNYVIPFLLMIPDRPNNKALIYLHPSGKSAEAAEGGEIEWFVKNGFTVLAPDLIGTGKSNPFSMVCILSAIIHPYLENRSGSFHDNRFLSSVIILL